MTKISNSFLSCQLSRMLEHLSTAAAAAGKINDLTFFKLFIQVKILFQSDIHFMVIVHDQSLSDSYIINGDGSQRLDVQITSPDGASADYAAHAQPAMVAGKLHLFGGWTGDDRKVSRFSYFHKFIFFQDHEA